MAVTGQRLCDLFISAAQDIIERAGDKVDVLVPGKRTREYFGLIKPDWDREMQDTRAGPYMIAGNFYDAVISPRRELTSPDAYPIGSVQFAPQKRKNGKIPYIMHHGDNIAVQSVDVCFTPEGKAHVRAISDRVGNYFIHMPHRDTLQNLRV